MKKISLLIPLLMLTSQKVDTRQENSQRNLNDEFSQALAEYMLSEKKVDAVYRKAEPQDRVEMKKKMLLAGIRPEDIIEVESITTIPETPKPAVLITTKTVETEKLTDAQLEDMRKRLKPTTPSSQKTFAPLPGKPTEKELQDALAERARKRESQQ